MPLIEPNPTDATNCMALSASYGDILDKLHVFLQALYDNVPDEPLYRAEDLLTAKQQWYAMIDDVAAVRGLIEALRRRVRLTKRVDGQIPHK